MNHLQKILVLSLLFVLPYCSAPQKEEFEITAYKDGRPYTRWWWHAMKFTKADIENQLVWLRDQGFGGVEISFIYPVNRDPEGERFEWLGKEWQQMVVYAKRCADSLGLGCDFTYGTLWPFGGTFVSDDDRSRIWTDSAYKQPLRLSWTHPDTGNVIDHMNRVAFRRYADVMSPAFAPAMKGSQSALFCDSWEVHTQYLWTPGFEKRFLEKFGYDIIPFMDNIYAPNNAGPRYDYMKLVSHLVLNEFYIPFHEESCALGGISRAQVAGAPTDLISGYAAMDIPETEAMLYEPNFSRIVASAAALAGKPYVSSESFTCLYGWPRDHMFEEKTTDLKLVADALFANGVNQHIWHGTPFNPIGVDTIFFYATVHVGERGNLTKDLIPFNDYLTRVSNHLRFGRVYSDVAIYLPLEDRWIEGELPEELQMPWSWGAYELRYEYLPEELNGYHPLWINADFLEKGVVKNGRLKVNDLDFGVFYADVEFLDIATLNAIYRVASEGLPVVMKNRPRQAGHKQDPQFESLVDQLFQFPNVSTRFQGIPNQRPLVEGENLPEFWARTDGSTVKVFFSNPLAKGLKYPLRLGFANQAEPITKTVTINFAATSQTIDLVFKPFQSLLLSVDKDGAIRFHDIELNLE